MNLRQAVQYGADALIHVGIPDAEIDARLLLEWVTGITLAEYAMDPFRMLTEKEENEFRNMVKRRRERVPLQHITGEQEFMGLTFQVNPDVLIPRQDTETLVEAALKRLRPGMQVLDLCTGSGCIAISMERIGDQKGKTSEKIEFTGSDISHKALQTARKNADRLGAKVRFIESDLFENVVGAYDMIVSNPPYIPSSEIGKLEPEVRRDPALALDGREDGLFFYRRIIGEAKEYLKDRGWLLLEIGCDQGTAVTALMREEGYEEISRLKDLAGLDRVIVGRYYR